MQQCTPVLKSSVNLRVAVSEEECKEQVRQKLEEKIDECDIKDCEEGVYAQF
jgi:hypothetical protein